MKGVIFTQFVEFVTDRYGGDTVARLTAPDGAPATSHYRATGNYDHAELVTMADAVAAAVGEPRARLLERFGAALFAHFAALYPVFFYEVDSALSPLARVETYVHGELKKLYPDAEFPRFECVERAPGTLEMTYRSTRPLADVAEGLIRGCIEHFGDSLEVHREDLPGPSGCAARFSLVGAASPRSRRAAGSSDV